jgi:hypothetical protein
MLRALTVHMREVWVEFNVLTWIKEYRGDDWEARQMQEVLGYQIL